MHTLSITEEVAMLRQMQGIYPGDADGALEREICKLEGREYIEPVITSWEFNGHTYIYIDPDGRGD